MRVAKSLCIPIVNKSSKLRQIYSYRQGQIFTSICSYVCLYVRLRAVADLRGGGRFLKPGGRCRRELAPALPKKDSPPRLTLEGMGGALYLIFDDR